MFGPKPHSRAEMGGLGMLAHSGHVEDGALRPSCVRATSLHHFQEAGSAVKTTSEVLDVGGPSQDWWDARMRSCENHGESGDTALRTFEGEMRSHPPSEELDDTAMRDLEGSPRTEISSLFSGLLERPGQNVRG